MLFDRGKEIWYIYLYLDFVKGFKNRYIMYNCDNDESKCYVRIVGLVF